MIKKTRPIVLLSLALLLSSCGGGGQGTGVSGGSSAAITPPTTPAPVSSSSPAPPAQIAFGALGQTSSQAFDVLGYSYRAASGAFDLIADPTSVDPSISAGLRLVAPSDLLLSVAGYGEGKMSPNGGSGTSATLGLIYQSYNVLAGSASISLALYPGGTNTLQSTATGSWERLTSTDPKFPYLVVEFVYGVPTRSSGVPQVGTAVYEWQTVGARPLRIDFAARTIGGAVVLGYGSTSVTYSLINGVLSSDGTFRANLRAEGAATQGVFEGRLTGPAGQELMARSITRQSDGSTSVEVWAATRI